MPKAPTENESGQFGGDSRPTAPRVPPELPRESPSVPRLPWQRHDADSFHAFPEGQRWDRFASIAKRAEGMVKDWHWGVSYDGARLSGEAEDRQAAADAATAAWSKVVEMAGELRRAEMAEALLTERLQQIAGGDPLILDQWLIPESDSEQLRKLVAAAQRIWAPDGRFPGRMPELEKLMAAVSAELYRRRVVGSG